MKYKIFALSAIFGGVSWSATYNVTNITGTETNGVVDSSGALVDNTNANFWVGTFVDSSNVQLTDGAIQSISNAADLESQFNTFGSITNFNDTSSFFYSNGGVFSGDFSAAITGDPSLSGKNLFVVVFNGATIGSSSEFLLAKTNTILADIDDDNPAGIEIQVTTASTSVLIGNSTANDIQTHSFGTSVDAFTMGALIPEPTSTMLLALGSFAFVVRRRR